MSGKHAQNEGNTPAPEAGARPRPNTVREETERSAPQQGPRETRHPENSNPKEGLVKGDYSHLLHEPKISSTRHELPKDIAAFDHHFADGKKKKADKKS